MILDIIFICILIFCIVHGFKRGFVKSLFNLLSFIASIIIAFMCYDPITEFVASSAIGIYITDIIVAAIGNTTIDLSGIQSLLHLPADVLTPAVSGVQTALASDVAKAIIGLLSVIVTIIVVKFGIKLILKLLNSIMKLPVLKQVNGLVGGIFGAVCGIFWIVLTLYALSCLSSIPSLSFLGEQVQTSYIADIIFTSSFFKTIPFIKKN